jgi:hypothetical protein
MSQNLRALLSELEAASSPLERLRRLALAWRTVRQLEPRERADLATHIGLDGAEDLVEKLARRKGGLAPTKLLEAVHAARQADPSQLRQLVAGLRDPEQRRGLVERGLAAVEARLAPEDTEDGEATEVEPGDGEDPVAGGGAADVSLEPTPTPPVEIEPAEPPPPPSSAEERTTPEPTLESTTPPAPPGADEPFPLSEPEPPAPAAPPLSPPPPPTASPPEPLPTPAPVSQSLPEPTVEDDGAAGRGTLVERLRAVRRAAGRPETATATQVRALLDTLPPGWAQRRALGAILEAGSPATVSAALDLIADLPEERDRIWCLAALAAGHDLDDEDLEAALDLVRTPAGRRRVLRRLQRAG